MKIKLVFNDWMRDGQSVYNTRKGVDLSMGHFHSGTVFEAEIKLDDANEDDLRKALEEGYEPHFYVVPE